MNSLDACHVIDGCPGVYVDAFQGNFLREKTKNPKALFILSHYHGDHYQQLPRNFKYQGPAAIHCTTITARLLTEIHEVPSHLVIPHSYGASFEHPLLLKSTKHDKEKETAVTITFYDAHHCPGACIVVVELPNGGNVHVHTCDMRYNASLFQTFPKLRHAVERNKIDTVYLDTTYSHPKHDFCPQEDAIDIIASEAERLLVTTSKTNDNNDDNNNKNQPNRDRNTRKTLVMLSCYSIGKEKVLLETSKRCHQPVYVSAKKLRMLQCLGGNAEKSNDDCNSSRFHSNQAPSASDSASVVYTRDLTLSDIHVIPMGLAGEMWPFFRPNFQKLAKYIQDLDYGISTTSATETGDDVLAPSRSGERPVYDRVVAFIPTGWANASNWNKKNAISTKTVEIEAPHGKTRTVQVEVRLVSYSEHSSFSELEAFVKYLRPRTVIPTVFSNEADSRKIVARFRNLLDHTKAQKAFFQSMCDAGCQASKNHTVSSGKKNTGDKSSRNEGHARRDTGDDDDDVIITEVRSAPITENPTVTASHVETLVAMGFREHDAKRCLCSCGDNLSVAIDTLLKSDGAQTQEHKKIKQYGVTESSALKVGSMGSVSTVGKRKRSKDGSKATQITKFFGFSK